MIRKSGWLVLLVVVALVVAVVYLFAGMAVRSGMVYALEKAAGAEVNIDSVEVGLAPLQVTIKNLQVTNLNNPSHNAVSFKQANAALALWPALLGYYVVDELTVDGLAFGSERARPGKVYRGAQDDAQEAFDLTDALRLDLPNVDELIARADLQTTAQGEALVAEVNAQREKLEALEGDLPNKATLDQLEADIKALTSSKIDNAPDLAAKAEQLKKLKQAVQAERDRLSSARERLQQSRQAMTSATQALRAASAQDWQKLQQLANLGDGGLAPLSQILLGDFWGKKIAQAETLYRFARPYLPEQTATANAASAEPVLANRILPLPRKPYPNLWVKQARVNWLLAGGEANLQLLDITREHTVIGRPTRLTMDASGLPQLASATLNGEFAIREQLTSKLDWSLAGYEVQGVNLGSQNTNLKLTDARANFTGGLTLVDRQLTQNGELTLLNPAFVAPDNRHLQKLAEVLNQQQQIPLKLTATGEVSDPDISVRSPLDRVLGDALLGEAKQKIAAYQQQLKAEVDQSLQQYLGAEQDWARALESREAAVAALEQRTQAMLDAKLKDLSGSATDLLKERLFKAR